MTYEFDWEEIVGELTSFGVQAADKVVDYCFNFARVIYEMADGRYHYDPPAERSLMLPAHANFEMRF